MSYNTDNYSTTGKAESASAEDKSTILSDLRQPGRQQSKILNPQIPKSQILSDLRQPGRHQSSILNPQSSIVRLLFLLLILALSTTSCVRYQELVNFNETDLVANSPEQIVNAADLEIQPEDLLRITVTSVDPVAAEPFNPQQGVGGGNQNGMMMGGGGQGGNTMELFMGYFVDRSGYIDFPVLGQVEVAGLTLDQVKYKLIGMLDAYLVDPVVNIRFLNFKVTVLGEVNAPGVVRLTNKRVTLLEALGYAGDLTQYADRRSVLITREEAGVRTYARLNLQSDEIFTSPYFYLQQNDVIYVQPIQARVATVADPATRIFAYTSGILSLTSIIIALTSRN
jgi:polysaccharide export outer membrane protein